MKCVSVGQRSHVAKSMETWDTCARAHTTEIDGCIEDVYEILGTHTHTPRDKHQRGIEKRRTPINVCVYYSVDPARACVCSESVCSFSAVVSHTHGFSSNCYSRKREIGYCTSHTLLRRTNRGATFHTHTAFLIGFIAVPRGAHHLFHRLLRRFYYLLYFRVSARGFALKPNRASWRAYLDVCRRIPPTFTSANCLQLHTWSTHDG